MIECFGSYIISFEWATWNEIEMEMEIIGWTQSKQILKFIFTLISIKVF